jgi:uncharacterized protein YaiE (UPF0345 family)
MAHAQNVTGDNLAIGSTFKSNTPPTSGAIIQGNVGIGTSSPTQLLQVYSGTTNARINIDAPLSSDAGFQFLSAGSSKFGIYRPGGTSNLAIDSDITPSILYLKEGGNVGIGTSSPTQLLQVYSGTTNARINIDAPSSSDAAVQFLSAGSSKFGIYRPGGTSDLAIDSDLAPSIIYLKEGGNVGIGTSGPTQLLQVYSGSTNARVNIDAPFASNAAVQFSSAGSSKFGIYRAGSTNDLAIDSDLVPSILYLKESGNVGIGTTGPAALLDIGSTGATLGTLRFEGNTSGYVQVQPAAAAGSWTMTLPANAGSSGSVLQTNGSGVTSWAATSAIAPAAAGRLQCGGASCTSTGSTTINYCPYKGNVKTTASQGNYTISSGCLSATTTNMYVGGTASQSVAANTLYYIYLWNNGSSWVLDAETTGHATDSSTGIEIKNGDNTKTLVGMIYPDASKYVYYGGAKNTVATWDNRSPTTTTCQFSTNRTSTSSASPTEVNSENRCKFMSWGDSITLTSNENGYLNTTGSGFVTVITLDGSATVSALGLRQPVANEEMLLVAPASYTPTEGYHFTELLTQVNAGTTITYFGATNTMVSSMQ